MRAAIITAWLCLFASFTLAGELKPNQWVKVSENSVGPRDEPGLVWHRGLKRFVLFGGEINHRFVRKPRPYDVQSFDLEKREWRNDLPAAAKGRGEATGTVSDPGFKGPYFGMTDKAGLTRPNVQNTKVWDQYAIAPWDGRVYTTMCGRTLSYDPSARAWKDLKPKGGPLPDFRGWRHGYSWGAMCADPVNKEILFFGGCGANTPCADIGTWVYSTEKNQWRDLKPGKQPPQRALSPMAYDPATKKIVLFGGDHLDYVHADTWVYDCQTRKWEERKPALSPSPRFGHALLYLPKSKKIVLLGGKGYQDRDTRGRCRALPFEAWTYDVEADKWALLKRLETGAPPQNGDRSSVAAVSDADVVMFLSPGKSRISTDTWLCRVEASKADAAGTAKHGVKPGARAVRAEVCDPEWYAKDVPAPDPTATAAILKKLPANKWVQLKAPKWPGNRGGGTWSTVALDTDLDQILWMGGGHASYFGNDLAHYDVKTGRWSLACRPMFALEYNGQISGAGPFAFNLAPWGNHNYHAYAYDPVGKRMAIAQGGLIQMYDPAKRTWPFEEKAKPPFTISKYTTYLVPTPKGIVAWTRTAHNVNGFFRLEKGRKWVKLPLTGTLPVTVCDGSTVIYDPKRDRLVMTTVWRPPGKGGKGEPKGQVWIYDMKTGAVEKKNPAGMGALGAGRAFTREAAYLAGADMIVYGRLLAAGGRKVVPVYDVEKNIWLGAEIPGSEFLMMRAGKWNHNMGLVRDPKRDIVWGVEGRLKPGSLHVLRLDRKTLKAEPLK